MNFITVIKGDDTNFVDDQFIVIYINANIDFTGFKAQFKIGDITIDYDDISSKRINVVLSTEVTSALEVGKQYAELKLIDDEDRIRTVTSVIPIKVIDRVDYSPTYANNTLEIKTEINTTEMTINVETSGMTPTERQQYLNQLESLKNQAQGYATTSSQASSSASTSATNASNYANNALDYKDQASISASNALSSANYAESKVDGFDSHVADKTTAFDTNASNKTTAFNSNATDKTTSYNNNATSKTNDFNSNYSTKKALIDNAVTQAQRYATGTPSEPDGYSAKYWAEEAKDIVSQGQLQSDWNQTDDTKKDYIKNKPALKTVATSGSYTDLTDKPTIPTVPTTLSSFTDDLGTSPTHTHSQYLTEQDISGKEDTSNKGVANGYAELDSTGKVPTAQLPSTLPAMSSATNKQFLTNNGSVANWANIPMPNAYCFTKGKVNANGEPDLLDITDTSKVVFNVDNNNPLVGALADGTEFTRTSIPDLDCSELADGDYNLFVGESGACIPLANTIYKQKKQIFPFEQPVLSDNGTLGGDSFAVYASSNYEEGTQIAYCVFDSDDTNYWSASDNTKPVDFIIYNPLEINITNLNITNSDGGSSYPNTGITTGTIYGSNDNTDWVEIQSFNNSTTARATSWDLSLSSNSQYYKYYKIHITDTSFVINSTHKFIQINKIKITANVRIASENDVWLDTSVKPYKSYKSNGSDWEEFNYVNLPQSITVESGVITTVYKSDVNFGENWQMDGDWVTLEGIANNRIYQGSLNATTNTSVEIDLSNILPKDDYRYQIILGTSIYGDGTNKTYAFFKTVANGSWMYQLGTETITTNGYQTLVVTHCVIEKDHKIWIRKKSNFSTNSNSYYYMIAFRRLGVN